MKRTLAVALVALGALEFLSAVGVLHRSIGHYMAVYWPCLLIAFGLELMWGQIRRGGREFLLPLAALLFGALYLLRNLRAFGAALVSPGELILGILLIYFGAVMLGRGFRPPFFPAPPSLTIDLRLRPRRGRRRTGRGWNFGWAARGDPAGPADEGAHWAGESNTPPHVRAGAGKRWRRVARFAGEIRIGDNPWTLEPLTVHNTFGEVRVNLGTATVSPGETPIEIAGFAGEFVVLVPEGLAIQVDVGMFAGEVKIFDRKENGVSIGAVHHTDPGYEQADRRVRIRILLRFGEVTIKRVA